MSRVAPLGRLPSIDAKNSKDGRNKGSDSSAGAAEEDDGVLDGIKDHVLSIDDNFVELFFSSDLYLHMTTVMSALNLMILTVGLLSDRMLVGENTVEGGTEMASAGMWKVSYGTEGDTEEFALCSSINPDASGWPDETASPSFCRAVNASRAFFILAIAVDLFAVVCGLVSWIGGERYKSWADEQMFTYIASGFFGLIGWIVWMACVDKKMNTMLRDSMLDEAGARGNKLCIPSDEQGYTVGNCPTDSVYPYITLGYSYGFLAWAAIFPIMYEPAYSLCRTAVVTQPSTNTCDKSSPPSAPFLRSNHSVSQALTCTAAVHIPTTTTLHLAPAKAHLDEDDAASARC